MSKQERQSSVLWGKDSDALNILIPLHAPAPQPRILDCTTNQGVMWRGTAFQPVRMDKDGQHPGLNVVADFKELPFAQASFDVLVFDPPHIPADAASENASRIWERRYGLTDDPGRAGENVSALFAPFLREAQRVLRPDGIVLAKIADLVHNRHQQWQHIDLITAAAQLGMCPCDMLIKINPDGGQILSSKWQRVLHLRKAHCFWIVIRNSARCEAPGRAGAPIQASQVRQADLFAFEGAA